MVVSHEAWDRKIGYILLGFENLYGVVVNVVIKLFFGFLIVV